MYNYKELKQIVSEAKTSQELDNVINNDLYSTLLDDDLIKKIQAKAKSLLRSDISYEDEDQLNDILNECEFHLESKNIEDIEFVEDDDFLFADDDFDNY